jgi:hypothetical protein
VLRYLIADAETVLDFAEYIIKFVEIQRAPTLEILSGPVCISELKRVTKRNERCGLVVKNPSYP